MTGTDPRTGAGQAGAAPARPDQAGLSEAEQIQAAVLACPDVAAVSAGAFGEVAAYLPGRRVNGVQIEDAEVAVHIVARYGQPLTHIAEQVGTAVAPMLDGRSLRVAVEDILLPGETLIDPAQPTRAQD